MRIAIDILSAATGGPGQYIIDFLPHLARRAAGDEIHVLAAHPELLRRLPQADDLHVHDIPSGRRVLSRLLWQWRKMPRWARDHGIDVVFLPQGLTAMNDGPPMVVLHQDSTYFCRERFGRSRIYAAAQAIFTRRTMTRAKRALFVTHAIRSLAESRGWLGPAGGSIVRVGVDTEALRACVDPAQAEALRREGPYVLTVSSVMPHKNVHTLIDAMSILRERGRTDIRLCVGGEAAPERPYARRIRDQISAERLSDQVQLLGHLSRPVLAAYYQAARMYVTLSLLEAHPLTPIEAMSFGVPVVVNRLDAFEEVCGDAAKYVDGADAGTVADAIARLWDDEPRRTALASKGLQRVARFSWSRVADDVYNALCDAAGAAPNPARPSAAEGCL